MLYGYQSTKASIGLIENKKITAGHAKILVGLENAEFIANKIIEKNYQLDKLRTSSKFLKKSLILLDYLKTQHKRSRTFNYK